MRTPLLAMFALAGLAFVAVGCPSDPAPDTSDGGDVDAYSLADAASLCENFTHNGQPCSPVSPLVCFRQCVTDGCSCKGAPGGGGGVWVCTTDFSCMPDGGPLDDSGPDLDSGSDAATDAGADSPAEAATDAGADASSDAPSDGDTDGAADAPSDG